MAKPRRAQHAHTSYRVYSTRQLDDRTTERQALLDRARVGSADAHGALLHSFRPAMLRYFAARLSPALRQKADEDDLTQTACIHALRCFTRFTRRELRSYWAWLRKICHNVLMRFARWCREAKRDPRREEVLDELRLEDGSQHPCHRVQPSAEQIFETLETLAQLQAALDQLPDDERRIVLLRVSDGWAFAELARLLSRSSDSIERSFKSCVQRLRRWVAGKAAGLVP